MKESHHRQTESHGNLSTGRQHPAAPSCSDSSFLLHSLVSPTELAALFCSPATPARPGLPKNLEVTQFLPLPSVIPATASSAPHRPSSMRPTVAYTQFQFHPAFQ